MSARKLTLLWHWLDAFAANVWRRNDYYSPGQRVTIRFAAFMATVIAQTRREIRKEAARG